MISKLYNWLTGKCWKCGLKSTSPTCVPCERYRVFIRMNHINFTRSYDRKENYARRSSLHWL